MHQRMMNNDYFIYSKYNYNSKVYLMTNDKIE